MYECDHRREGTQRWRPLLKHLKELGIASSSIQEALDFRLKFSITVSNLKLSYPVRENWTAKFSRLISSLLLRGGPRDPLLRLVTSNFPSLFFPRTYLPMTFGNIRIRIMYGPDLPKNLDEAVSNLMFDSFICHGTNDGRTFFGLFGRPVLLMGYPRLEGFWTGKESSLSHSHMANTQTRKTLLYLPSFGFKRPDSPNSLPFFFEFLRACRILDEYDIVVRPHPLSGNENSTDLQELRGAGITIDESPFTDVGYLLRHTDLVVGDYGDSPWTALYSEKPLVLIRDVSFSESPWVLGSSNSSLEAHALLWDRTQIGDKGESLKNFLANWHSNSSAYGELRSQTFEYLSDKGSEVVGQHLLDLLALGEKYAGNRFLIKRHLKRSGMCDFH